MPPDALPDSRARRDRFKEIYDANYHRVLGYALRRVGREDAGDVVAETFLVAWRRLDEVPDGAAAPLWLYGTARRVLANQRRGARRRRRLVQKMSSEGVQQTPIAAVDETTNLAARAFSRLRFDDRELLALVAWEGLDASQVAQVYGCSRNAARIRIHRARRRFARELDRVPAPGKQNPGSGHVTEAYE